MVVPLHLSLQEKEAISNELAKLKKEQKSKSICFDALSKELATEKKEHQKVVDELEAVTSHRDRLLDKVERLHADKHTLEARYIRVINKLMEFRI